MTDKQAEELNQEISTAHKVLKDLKPANNQIKNAKNQLKHLKTLKKKQAKEHEHRYVVLCGARAHFDSWGNHDMTTSYADRPSGYGDIGYYCRIQQIDYYDTFSIGFDELDKNYKLKYCYTFNKHWLHKLYRWLAKKPLGDILVKLAKRNTIRVK